MISLGCVPLFYGWRLTATVLGAIGFTVGALLSFSCASAVLRWLGPSEDVSCWVLDCATVGGGLVCGLFVRANAKACFFILGAGLGGVLGYQLYSLVHVLPELFILLPACLGGCAGLWYKERILMLASALVGAWLVVLGITYLVLVPIDVGYAAWLTPATRGWSMPNKYILPFVGWLLLSMGGYIVQRKWKSHHARHGDRGEPFIAIPSLGLKPKTKFTRLREWWNPPQAWWQRIGRVN